MRWRGDLDRVPLTRFDDVRATATLVAEGTKFVTTSYAILGAVLRLAESRDPSHARIDLPGQLLVETTVLGLAFVVLWIGLSLTA